MVKEVPADASEEWRPVVGWEETYEISSHGRLRRVKNACGTRAGRYLTDSILRKGYIANQLWDDGAGRKPLMIERHRLVADAFLGPRIPPLVTNHIDGNKRNNVATNLEYITHAENVNHAVDIGLLHQSGEHKNAKLSCLDVRDIRRLYGQGQGLSEIGRQFHINPTTVLDIIRRKTWKRVP